MTKGICESVKERYSVQHFPTSRIMETSEKYLTGLVFVARDVLRVLSDKMISKTLSCPEFSDNLWFP